jgi:hypothetical protein
MPNSQNLQKSSSKEIVELIDGVLDSTQRYSRLKKAASQSNERAEIVAGIAVMLEHTVLNYSSVIWNHKLLTFAFEQRSKENLKAVSQSISNFLSGRIKDPSRTHEINTATYTRMSQEIGHINEVLQGMNQRLTAEVNEYEKAWLDRIEFVKHVILIPDLAKELKDLNGLLSCMEEIKTFFEKCKNVQDVENMATLKNNWSEIKARFDQYKGIESYEGIKRMYDFSEETMPVIRVLLEGNELPLSSISPKVLEDLYKFKDFCGAVSVKFKPPEKNKNGV